MLTGSYDQALVLVSILVAIAASYTALALAERVGSASPRAARWWIAGGAFAMGTGIWAMHFIGMLAFRLPIPLGYDLSLTLASWLLPVLVSALALWQLAQPRLATGALARSALLFGVGINAMHYLGMAAMRMDPGIVWDWDLVAASVAIAIGAAAASLWIAFRLRGAHTPHVWLYRGAAAVVMGAAIVGMHYTGMAAANFPVGSVCRAATGAFNLTGLSLLVIVAAFAVLAIALLTSVFDSRLEARSHGLAQAEQASRERQHLLDAERAARSEAERLSAMKDQFLATLSHELRTPLNAILGWTQLLLRHRHDPTLLDRGLETVERNARLQAQLIEDLLDMSRIVSGQVRLDSRRLELAEVIESALETARPAALAKDIELQAELDPAAGPVWGDQARLQQVMWNLLMNAVKFTPHGGRVRVTLQRQAGEAVATVADNGVGIEPSFLPFVFDRFRQADASTTRRHGGLGIGLSIVQQLVQLHGGTVQAASAGPGHGASFSVRLPIASSAGGTARGEAPVGQDAALPSLQGVRVLVVDDDADARHLARYILQGCGATVSLAAGAAEALALARSQRPHVLVSDIAMPDVDGFQLVRQLRAQDDPWLAAIPAIALTAFTRAQDEQRAVAEGFQCFVRKPVDAVEFVRQVAALAGAAGPARAHLHQGRDTPPPR